MFDFLYNIFGFLFRIFFDFVGNYGLALFLFSLFFRLILLPTSVKQQKASAKQVRLQPKLRRIREKYQDYAPNERNQRIQMETNELYQREGYSSMTAGCAPMLIQLPILWGLYGIIRQPLTYVLDLSKEAVEALSAAATELEIVAGKTAAYIETVIISGTNLDTIIQAKPELAETFANEIAKIKAFDFTLFGIDLGSIPNSGVFKAWGESTTEAKLLLLIPILSGLTSLLTSLLTQYRQKKNNPGMDANMQQMGCMMLMMPIMSLWFTFQFPAGMGMYWIFSNLFAFFQTLILGHIYAPRKIIAQNMVEETVYRRSYENMKKTAIERADNQD